MKDKIKSGEAVPWVWLNENENSAKADNGIVLVRDYNNGGPAVFLTPVHEAASNLLAALETLIEDMAETHQEEIDSNHQGDGPDCSYCRDIASARAVIAKANGL
jgi:hypothetical protein